MRYLSILVLLLSGYMVVAQASFETFSSFDGTQIAYTQEGSGRTVMLIHGFISNGSSWDKTVLKSELLQNGYKVIIPDLRGNGNSDKPQEAEAYANDAEIMDIKALANHLKLDAYFAIGYSRGAIVLAKLLSDEIKINKAVIGGMGLDFTNPEWDRRIMFQKAFSGEDELNAETSGAVNYAKSIGADLKILGFLQEFQPVTSLDELHRISAAVLVIAGDHDKENGDPEELQKEIPKALLKIVPGDHNNTYKSKVFADQVLDFFY
jgi:pimeloyl-ACP methyl ester carboxylesterase